MTPLLPKDHPTLINLEAILAGYADCGAPLPDLLPFLCTKSRWFEIAGAIFFKPHPATDAVHDVYVLVPLHVYNPLPDPDA